MMVRRSQRLAAKCQEMPQEAEPSTPVRAARRSVSTPTGRGKPKRTGPGAGDDRRKEAGLSVVSEEMMTGVKEMLAGVDEVMGGLGEVMCSVVKEESLCRAATPTLIKNDVSSDSTGNLDRGAPCSAPSDELAVSELKCESSPTVSPQSSTEFKDPLATPLSSPSGVLDPETLPQSSPTTEVEDPAAIPLSSSSTEVKDSSVSPVSSPSGVHDPEMLPQSSPSTELEDPSVSPVSSPSGVQDPEVLPQSPPSTELEDLSVSPVSSPSGVQDPEMLPQSSPTTEVEEPAALPRSSLSTEVEDRLMSSLSSPSGVQDQEMLPQPSPSTEVGDPPELLLSPSPTEMEDPSMSPLSSPSTKVRDPLMKPFDSSFVTGVPDDSQECISPESSGTSRIRSSLNTSVDLIDSPLALSPRLNRHSQELVRRISDSTKSNVDETSSETSPKTTVGRSSNNLESPSVYGGNLSTNREDISDRSPTDAQINSPCFAGLTPAKASIKSQVKDIQSNAIHGEQAVVSTISQSPTSLDEGSPTSLNEESPISLNGDSPTITKSPTTPIAEPPAEPSIISLTPADTHSPLNESAAVDAQAEEAMGVNGIESVAVSLVRHESPAPYNSADDHTSTSPCRESSVLRGTSSPVIDGPVESSIVPAGDGCDEDASGEVFEGFTENANTKPVVERKKLTKKRSIKSRLNKENGLSDVVSSKKKLKKKKKLLLDSENGSQLVTKDDTGTIDVPPSSLGVSSKVAPSSPGKLGVSTSEHQEPVSAGRNVSENNAERQNGRRKKIIKKKKVKVPKCEDQSEPSMASNSNEESAAQIFTGVADQEVSADELEHFRKKERTEARGGLEVSAGKEHTVNCEVNPDNLTDAASKTSHKLKKKKKKVMKRTAHPTEEENVPDNQRNETNEPQSDVARSNVEETADHFIPEVHPNTSSTLPTKIKKVKKQVEDVFSAGGELGGTKIKKGGNKKTSSGNAGDGGTVSESIESNVAQVKIKKKKKAMKRAVHTDDGVCTSDIIEEDHSVETGPRKEHVNNARFASAADEDGTLAKPHKDQSDGIHGKLNKKKAVKDKKRTFSELPSETACQVPEEEQVRNESYRLGDSEGPMEKSNDINDGVLPTRIENGQAGVKIKKRKKKKKSLANTDSLHDLNSKSGNDEHGENQGNPQDCIDGDSSQDQSREQKCSNSGILVDKTKRADGISKQKITKKRKRQTAETLDLHKENSDAIPSDSTNSENPQRQHLENEPNAKRKKKRVHFAEKTAALSDPNTLTTDNKIIKKKVKKLAKSLTGDVSPAQTVFQSFAMEVVADNNDDDGAPESISFSSGREMALQAARQVSEQRRLQKAARSQRTTERQNARHEKNLERQRLEREVVGESEQQRQNRIENELTDELMAELEQEEEEHKDQSDQPVTTERHKPKKKKRKFGVGDRRVASLDFVPLSVGAADDPHQESGTRFQAACLPDQQPMVVNCGVADWKQRMLYSKHVPRVSSKRFQQLKHKRSVKQSLQ